MKSTLLPVVFLAVLISCDNKPENKEAMALTYPETKKVDTVDTYFGTEVPDPYRWLEDDRSDETAAWVDAQNEVTFDYLKSIPYRNDIKDKLSDMWNYEKVGAPFTEGDYTYFFKNDGLQNQYVLYRYKNDEDPDDAEIFLDPNTFTKDGTTSLASIEFSKDGELLIYSISEAGSDWRKVIVRNVETNEIIGDTLRDVKFSGFAWKGKEGFYYSSYDKPEGSELSAMTDQHKLYFHKLGTSQSEDKVIFGGIPEEKHRYVGASVTEDGRYLVVTASISTSGNKLFIKDLEKPNADFITILDHTDSDTYVLHSEGTTLFLVTNLNAPNKKIVTTDISNPTPSNWKDLIPETENVLNAGTGGGYIFANYMKDAVSHVEQYDLEGNKVRTIELPGVGTASGFGAKNDDEELYFSFTNYIMPPSIYKYNIEEGTSELFIEPEINFNPEDFESKQIFYTSKDGTKIPMIITHKKGIELNGKNPTILYGYGGFNISLTPSFSVANAMWLDEGGIYAVANLRGGGEYGKDWHNAGTKTKKQNVFDDFIAAAEYLIENNYTSSDYLAIRGGSNGGLLVGATMTQRPNLVKVAIPEVGVLDMLRYHTFTAGAGWAYDYGTAEESKEMFEYLKGYSPLHNIKEGTAYPATLIVTADHDDRVVPAHSFKFAAELQAKHSGPNPVLIRIEKDAGHGAGVPVSKIIDKSADIFAFILYNMGYETLPSQMN